jgi:GT2 family glycosyltransferase
VIIPCFNGEELIGDAINSILNCSITTHILVVDNASSDSSILVVKNFGPQVQIIQNTSNEGFGKAINKGFEYGKKHGYDYFLILNQDAILLENTLERLLDFANKVNSKTWLFVSPYNLGSDGITEEYYFADNLKKRSEHSESKVLEDHNYLEVNFINAACWLINPFSLNVLRGFDKRFFMYGEDLDLCNRAVYKGYKMFVLENTFCIHHKQIGDYENNPEKMLALKLGETMALYLNPSISRVSKLKRFATVTLASFKLAVKGKTQEAGEKFRVNLIAVLRLIA